jgi:hypothetical protein
MYLQDDEENTANSGALEPHSEVFNPSHSVGVACGPSGEIVGLHIGAEVRDNTDLWLASEVLLLARLAHQKSRLRQRIAMAARGVPSYIIDQLGFPTAAEYAAMERAAFGE